MTRRFPTVRGGHMAWHRYRLSPADRTALFTRAGGLCELCRVRPAVHVDHAHACCPGRKTCGACIRGVLCQACNHSLWLWEQIPTDRLIDWTNPQRRAEVVAFLASERRARYGEQLRLL